MDLFPKEYKINNGSNGMSSGSAGFLSGKISLKSINFSNLVKLGDGLLRAGTMICIVLLTAGAVLWGGLFYYKNTLTKQIIDLKERQTKIFSVKDKEMAAKIINLEKSSDSAKGLLKTHIFVSQLFDKIASATLPQVQWRSMNMSISGKTIKASGMAANYSILAKQILALQESGFPQVVISGITLDKLGGVAFESSFNFDPKFLRKQ